MDGAITIRRHVNMLPEERLTRTQRHAIHFAATLSLTINPKTPFDTNAPMPTQSCQMRHEMRVGEPTIRSKDDVTSQGKQLSHLIQYIFIHVIGHTAAGMVQDAPHDRHCPSTIDD